MKPTLFTLCTLAVVSAAVAQNSPPEKPAKSSQKMMALATNGLAGQSVAVLPLTMAITDRRIPGGGTTPGRLATLRAADSMLADVLTERAPEATWVLPAELRRTAQRAGGLMPNPDKLGQSVMRAPAIKDLPDPLRTYVRQLVALVGGGRFALIPAALYVTPGPSDSLTVQLSAVLADARSGRVVYRTLAVGRGGTFADAYYAALGTIFPAEAPPPPPP